MKAQAHFSNLAGTIIQELQRAKHSVKVAMAYFTHFELKNALEDLAREGINVELVLNAPSIDTNYSLKDHEVSDLVRAGVCVFKKFSEYVGMDYAPTMHDKFCVIDGQTTITGSFNWTRKGNDSNDENIVVIRELEATQEFLEQFEELKNGCSSEDVLGVEFSCVPSILKESSKNEVTLKWNALGASSVEITDLRDNLSCFGRERITLDITTDFMLTAHFPDGSIKQKKAKAVVIESPEILHFSVSEDTIRKGGYSRLKWEVSGAKTVELLTHQGRDLLSHGGELTIRPLQSTDYTIVAKNELGDKVQHTIHVYVLDIKIPKITKLTIPTPRVDVNVGMEVLNFSRPRLANVFQSLNSTALNIPSLISIKEKVCGERPAVKDVKEEIEGGQNASREKLKGSLSKQDIERRKITRSLLSNLLKNII